MYVYCFFFFPALTNYPRQETTKKSLGGFVACHLIQLRTMIAPASPHFLLISRISIPIPKSH